MFKYNFQRFLYLFLLIIVVISCKTTGKISKIETNVIAIDTNQVTKADSVSLLIISPYKQQIEAEMNQVIGYTSQTMSKGNPEGLLNNFIADLILKKANEFYKSSDSEKVDFCLLNNGGLRATIGKGKIIKSNIFDLMPFENQLVVVTLDGEKTNEMFNYIAANGGEPISGFTMGIKDMTAVNVTINGKPFDRSKTYKIVTSDYLANGGDKMIFFSNAIKTELLGQKIRDVIIEYFIEENAKGNILNSKLDKRIYYEK